MENKHRLYNRKYIKFHRKLLIKIFGGVCEFCGTKKKLTFAHIKETGLKGDSRGSWKRYTDVADNPDCYKLLCKSCHLEFDRKRANQEI